MLKARGFKLIKGGKAIGENNYSFESAIATKTRLMGVVALKLLWRDRLTQEYLAQWFMLDAEEHGIYDYISVYTKNINETNKYTQQFMGSLGGDIVNLTEKEATYLINHYKKMNVIYNKEIPRENEFRFLIKHEVLLNEEELLNLQDKIYEEIESPIQLINFFMMRLVTKDREAMARYANEETVDYLLSLSLVEKAASLLKNKSTIIDRVDSKYVYSVEGLVDAQNNYFIVKLEVEVKRIVNNFRINNSIFIGKDAIGPEEVAERIKTQEHISLYKILTDVDKFKESVQQLKDNSLQYQFLQGLMFVEFRKNNDHVQKQDYHMGGDIKAIYFINNFKEFIVCYYDMKDFEDIYNNFLAYLDIRLEKQKEVALNGSIIYQYAEMQQLDFNSYLEEVLDNTNID